MKQRDNWQLKHHAVKRANNDNDSKKLQSHVIKLMGKKIKPDELPQGSKDKLLANDFKDFFITKVDRINETLYNTNKTFDTLSPYFPKRKCEWNIWSVQWHKQKQLPLWSIPFEGNLIQSNKTFVSADFFSNLDESPFQAGIFPES